MKSPILLITGCVLILVATQSFAHRRFQKGIMLGYILGSQQRRSPPMFIPYPLHHGHHGGHGYHGGPGAAASFPMASWTGPGAAASNPFTSWSLPSSFSGLTDTKFNPKGLSDGFFFY